MPPSWTQTENPQATRMPVDQTRESVRFQSLLSDREQQ
jgi:hypothetical protein